MYFSESLNWEREKGGNHQIIYWAFPGAISEGSFLKSKYSKLPSKEWPSVRATQKICRWNFWDSLCGNDLFPHFSRGIPKGGGSNLFSIPQISKEQLKEALFTSPQGRDRPELCSPGHNGTQLAFTLTMQSYSNPVPFDPALYSNRSEHPCLASLMHIILSGQ